MDARVYFHLVDSIHGAGDAAELGMIRVLLTRTDMHPFERVALERMMARREEDLRRAEVGVAPAPTPRAGQ